MAALAFALGSSLLWGTADYLGGLKSRTLPVALVLAVMYLTSLAVMTVVVAAQGDGPPGTRAVLAALAAGVVGIAALAAFYRALAIGTMSIVAPIASTGVALPVVVGIAGGDSPGVARAVGIVAAVAGVVLASREARPAAAGTQPTGGAAGRALQRRSVLLALVSGLGFGSYFVGAEIAARDGVAWALLLSRLAAAPIIVTAGLLALRHGAQRPRGRALLALAGIGVLDLGANAAYNHASTLGELSVVSVGSSLYPVTTVLLAAALLGERVRGLQRAGIALALAGVVLIAAGG